MLETEIKLAVPDLRVLRGRLRELRARLGKRLHEFNTLFDTPEGKLRRSDRLLRLRVYGTTVLLTFKGKSLPSPSAKGKYKQRRETEFVVSDASKAQAVLAELGFWPGFRYEKFRTEIRLPKVTRAHIFLDETPIGVFLEVEGLPRVIDKATRFLGYHPKDYITESYLALYADSCRARNLPMGDFLFRQSKKNAPARSFSLTKQRTHLN